jgi:hypothetical protein
MLPGHPHRVVVALLNICRWGVGCHAQTGRECQSYDPGDNIHAKTDTAWEVTRPYGVILVLALRKPTVS